MTVTVRTNLANNPAAINATHMTGVGGTGGTISLAANAGPGGLVRDPFTRGTWTAATTAVSGGVQYFQPGGLSAATEYTFQVWVRSSRAQTMRLQANFKDSAGTTVNTVNGAATTVAANTIVALTVTGTSGAAVDRVALVSEATTGGALWVINDTLDVLGIVQETGATVGSYFDGAFVNAASVMYAWTGTADASPSTATTYVPQIALVTKSDAPCDRVEVTITDLTPTENAVTVWRTSDGKRQAVRGVRHRTMVTSDSVVDYEAPLGRTVTYELEVTAGLNNQVAVAPQDVFVDAASGWIQDPLDPGSAIRIHGGVGPGGEAALRGQALSRLEYASDMSIVPIMGSPDPVALIGQRQSASGISLPMVTEAAQEAADLRRLIQQAPLILVRPLPLWASALPGLCYTASAKPAELPIDEAWGGKIVHWELTGDLVAAPAMNILIPEWTYGDVKALWATYQQAQTALTGKTYLDVKKSPSGV